MNNLGELNWHTGCDFKRNWELGTLEITQKSFVESRLNCFGANLSSDFLATLALNYVQEKPHREAVDILVRLSNMT